MIVNIVFSKKELKMYIFKYKIYVSWRNCDKNYVAGNSVASRKTGNIIKNSFIDSYENLIQIELNFKGIELVSHYFIDELIWAFIFHDKREALKRICFTDCNDKVKEMIKFVVNDNLNKKNLS